MKKSILFFFACAIFCTLAAAQTVTPFMALGNAQFFDNNGKPLTVGVLYSYQAGTSAQQATYTDSTGLVQNPNPLPFGSGARVSIWLSSGLLYKFVLCLQNDGAACAPADVLFSVDQVPACPGCSAGGNTFTGTFVSSTANPATAGVLRVASSDVLCWRNTANTTNLCISKNSNDILTWNGPAINATAFQIGGSFGTIGNCWQSTGVGTTFAPGCGTVVVTNATSTGTTLNTLTKLTGAPSTAVIASTTDTSGVIGITISGAGTTGSASIQQSGNVSCLFDGATTAGDYVQISSTTAGDCHDSGFAPPALPPANLQVVGQVLSTNGAGGTYQILFYAPGIITPPPTVASAATVTVNAATTSVQVIETTSFTAGTLNQAGKTFRVTGLITVTPVSSNNQVVEVAAGPSAGSLSYSAPFLLASTTSNAVAFSDHFILTCTVASTGASGVLHCSAVAIGQAVPAQTFTITGDLTAAFYVGTACSFSAASSSNSCTETLFLMEQLN